METVDAQDFGGIVGLGEIKFKDVYPTLLRLSSHKNATMAHLWGMGGGGGGCWEGVEVDVGRCLLEDPSKIRS